MPFGQERFAVLTAVPDRWRFVRVWFVLSVPVRGEKRLLLAAEVVCFQPWQAGPAALAALLLLAPFALALLRRWRGLNEAARDALEGPYRAGFKCVRDPLLFHPLSAPEHAARTSHVGVCLWLCDRRYWESGVLARRIVLVTLYTFVPGVFFRAFALFVVCFLMLIQHLLASP